MITIALLGLAILLIITSAVGFGAPYLPTLKKSVDGALDLLDLKPGQTMLELGSGDGRLLRAAARRKINSVGYELNPLLYLYSKISCYRYRTYIDVRFGNYWTADLPKADGVYVFLLEKYMPKLRSTLLSYLQRHELKSIKLASFGFPLKNTTLLKQKSGVFLYLIKNGQDSKE